MYDKLYMLKCRIFLAKEFDIPPDDIDVDPILEMLENSYIFEKDNGYTVDMFPETKKQEEAVLNKYYDAIMSKIFQDEKPFQGLVQQVMLKRDII